MFGHLISRWLFREGGQYNCAIARIAIGVALLLTITHNGNFSYMALHWGYWLSGMEGAGWTPKGLIKIVDVLAGGPPPAWTTKLIFYVCLISITTMILGLFSWVSQIVATLTAVYIVSLQTSFGPYWSHAYNVQLLAAIAFMFSRHSGDVFSLDSVIRKMRGQPMRFAQGHYWWPVIFAELATALFMFGAFFQKFRDTGVYWALSDNIRNSLVVTWFQYRSDPPAIAVWLASEPLVWQTAGLLQLFAQATTVLAAFLVARPVLRAIFGAGFFAAEVMALGHIFRFWHPFWVPLCLLSIDFEHFYRAIKGGMSKVKVPFRGPLEYIFQRRLESERHVRDSGRSAPRGALVVLIFGVVFFGYYGANIAYRLGERHLNYPFSTMGFYSVTRDRAPYAKHHYYPIYTGRIDAFEQGESSPVGLWYREGALEDNLFRVNTLEGLAAIHESFISRAKSGLYVAGGPSADPTENRRRVDPEKIYYRAGLMAVPPYPAPPGMVDYHMAYRAVFDENGFRALVARTQFDESRRQYYITVESRGFPSPEFAVLTNPGGYTADEIIEPVPMKGQWVGDRFYIDQEFDKAFTLIDVTDQVLGTRERYYGSDVF